jgi:G:T-mismatch repair DNA endonuclease (very short patch repair protein)
MLSGIIQYHGIAWHPISIEDDGVFRYIGEFFGKNREDAYLKDKYKEEVARDNGFKIFSVWSIETNKEYKVLKFIEESINEQ